MSSIRTILATALAFVNAPAAAANAVDITVSSDGFSPAEVRVAKGTPTTLKFTRTSDATCAKEVAFPELGIKKALPLNETVTIEVPSSEARTLTFQCGMGMYKSKLVIQ